MQHDYSKPVLVRFGDFTALTQAADSVFEYLDATFPTRTPRNDLRWQDPQDPNVS
jgi:hypothetical protein